MSPSLPHAEVGILLPACVKFPRLRWKLKAGFLKVQNPSGTSLPLEVQQMGKRGQFLCQHLVNKRLQTKSCVSNSLERVYPITECVYPLIQHGVWPKSSSLTPPLQSFSHSPI